MNLDKKQRNLYLDIMKGISIFLVLLGHSIQYGSKISYVGSRLFFNDPVFKLIYSFHMPLFALLSGYLFFYTIEAYSERAGYKPCENACTSYYLLGNNRFCSQNINGAIERVRYHLVG